MTTHIPCFHPFAAAPSPQELPRLFTCPFFYQPHPLAVRAAEEVKRHIATAEWAWAADEGKMFGVLVAEHCGQLGFLAAYSGLLDGRNDLPFFVPPVFDLLQADGWFKTEERHISGINRHIRALEHGLLAHSLATKLDELRARRDASLAASRAALQEAKRQRDHLRAAAGLDPATSQRLARESQFQKAEYKRLERRWKESEAEIMETKLRLDARVGSLKSERKRRSEELQRWLFAQFRLRNARGETKDLWQIFHEAARPAPPSGAGECAAPKLLQYAYLHGMRPLAMAEFWWGKSPEKEVRRHGQFYPACQSKCGPILRFMLQGLDVEPNAQETTKRTPGEPAVVYEDEWLLVVDKPAGMLSVPGKDADAPSVAEWARSRYPQATGPLVAHRLDMDTSGLLVVAKDAATHAMLQAMFERREVGKVYIALLDGEVAGDEGDIDLPLAPDYANRPLQRVDAIAGKPSLTHYKVLERHGGQTRVAFFPRTGRTHQLRVHAAHQGGLDAPIAGDNLYGKPATRLHLHAERLTFTHPRTGQRLSLHRPAPF